MNRWATAEAVAAAEAIAAATEAIAAAAEAVVAAQQEMGLLLSAIAFFYKMTHNFAQIRPEMGRISVKNWPLGGLMMPKNASGGLSGLVQGPAHH